MVKIEIQDNFKNATWKLKHKETYFQVMGQMSKIINNPDIGKPMMHERKGTREVYVGSFRLSYCYEPENDLIVFLDLYHKDEQ